MVKSAESLVKRHLSQSLKTETWIAYYDNFPCPERDEWWDGVKELPVNYLAGTQNWINIPMGPNVNVTEFVTIDDSDTEFVFPSSQYKVDSTSPQGLVSLAEGAVWPSTVLRSNSGIKITFTAGYGATDDDVPDDIKHAILETTAAMFEQRGDSFTGLPASALAFLTHYVEPKL